MLNRLAFCNYALADMKQKWRYHAEKWRHHATIWRHHASIWRHHDWIWRHHNFFNPVRIRSLVFFFFLLLSPLNGVSWRLSFDNFRKWSLIFHWKTKSDWLKIFPDWLSWSLVDQIRLLHFRPSKICAFANFRS